MPNMLNVKPEDIDEKGKRSKYKVSIIGCGQKGVIFSVEFAKAGFQVASCDANQSVVKKLSRGKSPFSDPELETDLRTFIRTEQLTVTSEVQKVASESDIIVITVPLKVDENKKIDESETINVLKTVGGAMHSGALVIYGEVAGVGFIQTTVKETLENTSGLKVDKDFILAYAPLQNLSEKTVYEQAGLELIVASTGKIGLESTINVLRTIAGKIKPALDIKTAEAAALFVEAIQDANRAMASELAVFCEKANIDYFEVSALLELKMQSFWRSTINGENRNDSFLLLENAENLDAKLTLLSLAQKTNEDIVKYSVNLTQEALRSCNKTLRRAKVAVLSFVDPNSAIATFVSMLESKGAKVSIYSSAARNEVLRAEIVKTSINETVEGADCIVVISAEGQEQFKPLNLKKLKALTKTPSAIVDLSGALEPKEVQTEGFLYRGFGRRSD